MDGRSRTAGAGWNEKTADGRKDTDEPLQVPGRPEALHHSLSSTERQMRILRPIVEPLVRAVFDGRHNLALGGRVGTKLVGDHAPGWAALLAQETPQPGRRARPPVGEAVASGAAGNPALPGALSKGNRGRASVAPGTPLRSTDPWPRILYCFP